MSFLKKLFGGASQPERSPSAPLPSQVQSSPTPQPSAARSQTASFMNDNIPDDPIMSEMDAMMNGAANALGYDASGGIGFITNGNRVVGIWCRAFPANTTKKKFLHMYCEMKNQRPGKDSNLTGIDAAVDSLIMGNYRISKATDKEGFNVHFL